MFRRVVLALVLLAGCSHVSEPADSPSERFPAVEQQWRLLPQGSALPSERECARRIERAGWEPRPENDAANRRVVRHSLPLHPDFDAAWQATYRPRITGAYRGTTDEIIQWAACKWGLDADLLRAQAFAESAWRMSAEGDRVVAASGRCAPRDERDPCPTSFGILQNKWFYNPGSYPVIKTSTAWHLDFSAAKLRGCYDGHKIIEGSQPAGDMWGCVGNWYSGRWHDDASERYVARVKRAHEHQPWRDWRG